MNDDPTPFEPDQVDELLSAALDGEFDAAAHDLGLSADEAAARLAATPGVDARRAKLSSARDLLATPVEIDELVAARLRTRALRTTEDAPTAAPRRSESRRGRWLMRSAGVAAAIAALVGLAFAIGNSDSTSKSASNAPASADSSTGDGAARRSPISLGPATPVASQPLGSYNTVNDLARAALGRATANTPTFSNKAQIQNGAKDAAVPAVTSTNAKSAVGSSLSYGAAQNSERLATKASGAGATARTSPCAVPTQVPVGSPLILRAPASLQGKPVTVAVFSDNGAHVVVVQDSKCALLKLQKLP